MLHILSVCVFYASINIILNFGEMFCSVRFCSVFSIWFDTLMIYIVCYLPSVAWDCHNVRESKLFDCEKLDKKRVRETTTYKRKTVGCVYVAWKCDIVPYYLHNIGLNTSADGNHINNNIKITCDVLLCMSASLSLSISIFHVFFLIVLLLFLLSVLLLLFLLSPDTTSKDNK